MSWWPEIFISGTGFLILVVYHVYLIYQVKNDPLKTSMGLTDRLRRDWVRTVMEDNRDLLAVQTLRNWVMASSFLASTAILVNLALINAAFRTEKFADISHALNFLGAKSQVLWLVKLLVLILDFFFAFFSFTLSIRYYNHASYAINIPPKQDPIVTYAAVAAIVNRGSIHYTLGMRAYYLSVPLLLWLFGPTWMLVGATTMTIILYGLDRTA
jgi:uncharacterized membrane protein